MLVDNAKSILQAFCVVIERLHNVIVCLLTRMALCNKSVLQAATSSKMNV